MLKNIGGAFTPKRRARARRAVGMAFSRGVAPSGAPLTMTPLFRQPTNKIPDAAKGR